MRPPIQGVEDSKHRALGPSGALREHHSALVVLVKACEQARNVLRCVLAVAVHDDDDIRRPVPIDEGERNGNRPLVTDIPAQRQHLDTAQGAPVVSGPAMQEAGSGPIVNQQDVGSQAGIRQHLVQSRKEKAGRSPIVVNRYKDEQFVRSARPCIAEWTVSRGLVARTHSLQMGITGFRPAVAVPI